MIESTIKIIIIDDEPAILDLSKQFLELNQDISADVASSAAEALELIKTQNYDTIVSDYQMPGKDGIQLLKEIRGTGNKIAFILFTGKGREDVAIEALNAGADFYLQKGGNPRAQFAELKNMIIKSVEKHRIELDLKDEEEKFKDIFNSANDSIHILDLDGRILEINDIGCKWLGYTKQEMLQKNVKEIDLEVYALQVPARIKEVMKKGFALFETEWMTKSGRIIPVEVSARSIDYAGRSAILSVVRDVTERKRNQEALAAIRNLLSETERIGKIGGWSFDVETLVQTWTDETFRILEIDLNEGEPKVPEGLSFIAPDFRPIAEQAMQRAIQFGEPYDQEWEIITMKGNRRWIHTVGTIHQENGKTRRVTGTFQDITERKRAEEELIQSEERFSKAFNSSPIGISIQRLADGFQIDVNETILQMFEFCRQEVIGHTTFELNIFTCQNQHEEYTHLLQEQGSIHNLEATFRTKTGKLINTIMSIDKLSIPGQDLVLTTLEDITDRKKAEEALRRSEENFRLLTEKSIVGIYVIQDAKMAYVNPSFAKTFGYSPEEIIGNLTPKDLVHPGDIQAVMRRLSERLDGRAEEGRVLHHKAIKKDGSPIIIEVSGAVFDYQGRPAVMGTLIDVTEQKQAQEALRRSEEKYRQLVESSSDGIFTIDLNAKINWANDYAYKLLGYSESDLPIALRKLIPIKYWPAAMKLFYGGLKGKIVTEPFDLEILTKSGERIPVSYKGTLLHDENGNVISILGVIREMRGSKKLNALPLGTEEDGRKSN